MSSVMSLSVLICTYNRTLLLDKALAALINNSVDQPDQIVVVNGGNAETN